MPLNCMLKTVVLNLVLCVTTLGPELWGGMVEKDGRENASG